MIRCFGDSMLKGNEQFLFEQVELNRDAKDCLFCIKTKLKLCQ